MRRSRALDVLRALGVVGVLGVLRRASGARRGLFPVWVALGALSACSLPRTEGPAADLEAQHHARGATTRDWAAILDAGRALPAGEDAHALLVELTPLLGAAAAGVFLVSLIASGVSSSVVGTMAGQMIMQGFIKVRIPVWLRRLVTMAPAFVVIAMGVNPTKALIMSQVVLSIALPVPMLALLHFTSSKRIMGQFANAKHVFLLAIMAAGVVLGLNFVLLALTFGVPVPFLPQ